MEEKANEWNNHKHKENDNNGIAQDYIAYKINRIHESKIKHLKDINNQESCIFSQIGSTVVICGCKGSYLKLNFENSNNPEMFTIPKVNKTIEDFKCKSSLNLIYCLEYLDNKVNLVSLNF